MILPGRIRGALGSFPFLKVAIGIGVAFYLYIAAAIVSTTSVEGTGLVKIIAFAVAPICLFCAFRYPFVFPFGVYVGVLPFDALLAASSSAQVVKLVGFAAMGAFVFRMVRLRTMLVPHPSWYGWLAFVTYCGITLLWAADPANGYQTIVTVSALFLLMTILAVYPITLGEFKIVAATAVLFGAGAGVFCIHQYYSGNFTTEVAPRLALTVGTTMIDVNFLAGSYLLPLAFALYGVFYVRNVFVKIVSCLCIGPYMGSIFVTGSRESLVAAVAIFAYFIIRGGKRLPAILLGAAAVGGMFLFPNFVARVFQDNAADGSGRTEIWATGMHSFGDHWLFGAGLGSYPAIYDMNNLQVAVKHFAGWHRPAHSVIFENLNDVGIIGTALILYAWYMSFRQLAAIPKSSHLYHFRVACEAIVIGYSIQALFIDPTYIKYIWLAHTLPLMLLNVYDPRMIGFRRHAKALVPSAQFTQRAHPGG